MHWDLSAKKVHGINRAELIHSGYSAIDVVESLNIILKNSVVYCDSINWDGFWLNVLFCENGISTDLELLDIQTLLNTEKLIVGYLHEKSKLLKSNVYQEHKALDDAQVIYKSLISVLT